MSKNAPAISAAQPPATNEILRNSRTEDEMIPLDDDQDVEPAPLPDDAEVRGVAQLAQDMTDLEEEIAELEAILERKRAAHKAIREGSLPLRMAELGMEGFDLIGGSRIEVRELIVANIAEANRTKAHAWLEGDGSGSIIKRTITVEFGKDEEVWAKKFQRDLDKRKKPLKYAMKEAVNYQTLGKFVRDKLSEARREGKDPAQVIPYDLFGIFKLRYAEHTPSKKGG